jgi:hypothetical protein
VPPASYSVPQDIRATFVRILAYMGGLAVLAIAAASLFREPLGAAAIEPQSRPEWVNIERPHPAFELQMPELAGSTSDYAIMRRNADGARKDVLSYGAAAASGPYVMVEIYRPGTSSERFIDAPSEIAARILAFTVVDDVKPVGKLDSKFGSMALVDFAIASHDTGDVKNLGKARRCLGFARAFDAPVMQIAGWYCSPGNEVVDRATLACALDRLTSLSAGGDDKLAGLFARAEVERTFCGQRSPILAATPERDKPVAIARRIKPRSATLPSVGLRGRISQR